MSSPEFYLVKSILGVGEANKGDYLTINFELTNGTKVPLAIPSGYADNLINALAQARDMAIAAEGPKLQLDQISASSPSQRLIKQQGRHVLAEAGCYGFEVAGRDRRQSRMQACMFDRPKVIRITDTKISPWVRLISKDVQFSETSEHEVFHSLGLSDYVHIIAQGRDGLIPLVKQYRPAVEVETLELPAGLLDLNEAPVDAALRELREETGFVATSIYPIGSCATDTGRMDNSTHSFFAKIDVRLQDFKPEPNITVRMVSSEELKALILTNKLSAQGQLGTIAQAVLHGHLRL